MTTAEAMALAVLKGDMAAARALCDHLQEDYDEGKMQFAPVTKITCDIKKLRVVLFLNKEGSENITFEDVPRMENIIKKWLENGQTLILAQCDRIEFYELP